MTESQNKQKKSGKMVKNYCKENGLNPSTFYEYVKKLKQSMCDNINSSKHDNINIVSFITVPNKLKQLM